MCEEGGICRRQVFKISEQHKQKIIDDACTGDKRCRWNKKEQLKYDPMFNLVCFRQTDEGIELYFRLAKGKPPLAEYVEDEMELYWCFPRVSTLLHPKKTMGNCCIATLSLTLRLGISPVHPIIDPPHILRYRNKRKDKNDYIVKECGAAKIRISSVCYVLGGNTITCISKQNKSSLGEPCAALAKTGITGDIYPCSFSWDNERKELLEEIHTTMDDNILFATEIAKERNLEILQKIKEKTPNLRTLF
ncbi:predicted protein [Chaetoceros tenuissimus]|uniref:Uncharacterized protein n=1 Tax=Chaetoceros tenuissimus TaxID=426638 RepID=A0AAD3CLU9_9STRA|nr:predicted protein [Chaetoceros tenuissimus]